MAVKIATPLRDGSDDLKQALQVFGGEVLAALDRYGVTNGKFIERKIEHGKSATFPIMGRTSAKYLKAGASLDDQRNDTQQTEETIVIDGLLTVDHLVPDIFKAMLHFDVMSEYAKQQGEALALSLDASLLAQLAILAAAKKENLVGLGFSDVIEDKIAAGDYGATEKMGLTIYQMLLNTAVAMDKNYVSMSDRQVFMLPEGHRSLAASLIAINRDFGAAGSITDANVIKLAGFNIYSTPHLTRGGDDNKNTMQGSGHAFPEKYAKNAMFIAAHRSSAGVLKLMDIDIEHARRPEYKADQIISSCAVGMKGLRAESTFMGVVAKVDAPTPLKP